MGCLFNIVTTIANSINWILEIMLELMFPSVTQTKSKSRNNFNPFRIMTVINRIGSWFCQLKNITAWKVSIFGVFPVHIFPDLHWIFSPSAGKCGPEKLPIRTLFTQCIIIIINIIIIIIVIIIISNLFSVD